MSTQQTLQNYFTTTKTSFIRSSIPDQNEAKLLNRVDNVEKKDKVFLLNQNSKNQKQPLITKRETVLSNIESKSHSLSPISKTNDEITTSVDLQLEFVAKKKKKRKKLNHDNKSNDIRPKKVIDKSIPLWKYSKSNCSFCQNTPATILITGKLMGSDPKPLCLNHYYTTRNVLTINTNRIHIIPSSSSSSSSPNDEFSNIPHLETQLSSIQEIFSQAFIELQKDIAEESARSFNQMKNSSDPLSILNDNRSQKQRQKLRKRKLKAKTKKNDEEGGFLRPISLPEKIIQHEKKLNELIQIQSELNDGHIKHSNNIIATKKNKMDYNPYKRRKPKKKSYWDLNESSSKCDPISSSSMSSTNQINTSNIENSISCRNPNCKSQNIKKIQNNANMQYQCNDNNQAMTKGEIWGYKDRDNTDINGDLTMNHCLTCGKVWKEEDDT